MSIIESDIARRVTESCGGHGCRIKIQRGEETCMGWPGPEYNRHGQRIDLGDPNRVEFSAACQVCGKDWAVRTKIEKVVLIKQRNGG